MTQGRFLDAQNYKNFYPKACDFLWNFINQAFRALCTNLLFQLNILSLYTLENKNETKRFADFIKKSRRFSNLMKNEFCWRQIFEIFWNVRSNKKLWPDRHSRFVVYLDTNRQTSKVYIYRCSIKYLKIRELFAVIDLYCTKRIWARRAFMSSIIAWSDKKIK